METKEIWKDLDGITLQNIDSFLSADGFSVVDGGILDDLEQAIAEFFHCKYCVAFCNGTAAIHAAAYSVFGCGSFINVPKYSYFGAVNALLENNCRVNILDINNDSLLTDLNNDENIKEDGNLFLTSIWGASYTPYQLFQYKKRHPKAKIIMDNSHAYGTLYNKKNICSYGIADAYCYSLGRGKFVDAGELGVALTNDKDIAMRMLTMGHPHRIKTNKLFTEVSPLPYTVGNKYRPHMMALFLAIQQMKRLPEKLNHNRIVGDTISRRLSCIKGLSLQKQDQGMDRSYWKIPIKINPDTFVISIQTLKSRLRSKGFPVLDDFQYSDYDNYAIWTNKRYENQLSWNSEIKKSKYDDWILLPGYIDISMNDIELLTEQFVH